MAPLGPFDTDRIETDIVQTQELIDRNEALLAIETDAEQVTLLEETLTALRAQLVTLNAYLD